MCPCLLDSGSEITLISIITLTQVAQTMLSLGKLLQIKTCDISTTSYLQDRTVTLGSASPRQRCPLYIWSMSLGLTQNLCLLGKIFCIDWHPLLTATVGSSGPKLTIWNHGWSKSLRQQICGHQVHRSAASAPCCPSCWHSTYSCTKHRGTTNPGKESFTVFFCA